MSVLAHPSKEIKQLFKQCQIDRERFLQVLSEVRGNQRVTSDNPESTYDTLEKYGTDLVERAKDGKLDPVIGRDAEIRNVVRILSRKTKNNPVLIRLPLLRAWHSVLFAEMCRKDSKTRRSLRWIWVPW